MSNANLKRAARAKADEFYTQLEDIERELKHYRAFLIGKTVYCNCDCQQSNFVQNMAAKESLEAAGLEYENQCTRAVAAPYQLSLAAVQGLLKVKASKYRRK